MNKFVKFLFWTIVAIFCGLAAGDLYSGNKSGAILMCISICGVCGMRWASGWDQTGEGRGP